jgi:hypothetical protein
MFYKRRLSGVILINTKVYWAIKRIRSAEWLYMNAVDCDVVKNVMDMRFRITKRWKSLIN